VTDVILIVAITVVVVLLARRAPRIRDAAARMLAGEAGSFMVRGLTRRGTRLRNTAELQAVVSRLAMITRLNLPLVSALRAAGESEPGPAGRTSKDMARLIDAGSPVSAALSTAFRGCPDTLTAVLRRAEVCGQLARALDEQERLIARGLDLQLNVTDHARHAVAYAILMTLFVGGVVAWIMVFLVPKFRAIFEDYDTPLPAITVAFIDAADWMVMYGWIILAVVALVAVTVAFLRNRRSEGEKTGSIRRLIAAVRWAIPVTRALDFGLGMAEAVRSVAHGIRIGSPTTFSETLPGVVSTTNRLRTRLAEFSRCVSDGEAPHKAAARAQLGEVFVCALDMVERGADADRVLGFAADYYEAIARRWWHALTAVCGPLVTLALAVLVGFVALALFLPIVTLINAVAESI